jgi:hypothetical protein
MEDDDDDDDDGDEDCFRVCVFRDPFAMPFSRLPGTNYERETTVISVSDFCLLA